MTQRPFSVTFAAPASAPSGKPSVPVEQWGKDHWSTFAYLETRAVDYKGVINHEHMRCDSDRHPGLANSANRLGGGKKYPTRLKNGAEKSDHDDWDCFEDLISVGLVTWEGTGMLPIVAFTDKGRVLAGRLRAFKAEGGNFAEFSPGTL